MSWGGGSTEQNFDMHHPGPSVAKAAEPVQGRDAGELNGLLGTCAEDQRTFGSSRVPLVRHNSIETRKPDLNLLVPSAEAWSFYLP